MSTTMTQVPESVLPRNCRAVESWKDLTVDQIVWTYAGDEWVRTRVLKAGRKGVVVTLDLEGRMAKPYAFQVSVDFMLVPR